MAERAETAEEQRTRLSEELQDGRMAYKQLQDVVVALEQVTPLFMCLPRACQRQSSRLPLIL